jgi:hypothetical protein
MIDVKGLYKRNYWIIKRKKLEKNLYFVLAYVPKGEPSEYFVLSHAEVIEAQSTDIERARLEKPHIVTRIPYRGSSGPRQRHSRGAGKLCRPKFELR